jgi:hypothetical protein
MDDSGAGGGRTAVLLGAAVAVALIAALTWGVTQVPPTTYLTPPVTGPGKPVTVALTDASYPFRCSASIADDVVQPGSVVHLTIDLANTGTSPKQYTAWLNHLRISDQGGRLIYDTGVLNTRAPPQAATLGPGRTVRLSTIPVAIRWPGTPLLSTSCPSLAADGRPNSGSGPTLPPIPLRVEVPGAAPSPTDAVLRAALSTDALFAHCVPSPDGSATEGTVRALVPSHPSPPPSSARCWAKVEPSDGFDVVTLYLATPAESFPKAIDAELNFPIHLHGIPFASAIRWMFVVTTTSVTSEVPPLDFSNDFGFYRPGTDFGYDWGFNQRMWQPHVYISCGPNSGGGGAGFELFEPSPPKCTQP